MANVKQLNSLPPVTSLPNKEQLSNVDTILKA